jgi:hypothetical protein
VAEKPSQPSPRRPAPAEPAPRLTAAQVAGIVGMLANGGDDELLIARVVSALVKAGFRRATARAAAGVTIRTRALSYPGTRTPVGLGSVANDRREPAYDAWFVANSARRIAERVNAGKDPEDAIRPERTYVDQRERARRARRDAADKVDAATKTPGNLVVNGRTVLGWAAHGDDKTTWECVAADGHWFYADRPPVIGYPGMPHGGTCRCWPIPATALMLTGDPVDVAVRSAQPTADHPAERTPKPVPDREAEAS